MRSVRNELARGIVKHRDDCGMLIRALGHANSPLGKGVSAEEAVPFDDSLFVGTIDLSVLSTGYAS
jgi:hypothetical protein